MLAIGTINLVVLLTSSLICSSGLTFIEMDRPQRVVQCCVLTVYLGTAFLVSNFWEWLIDIHDHLFPLMVGFKISGRTKAANDCSGHSTSSLCRCMLYMIIGIGGSFIHFDRSSRPLLLLQDATRF